MKFNCKTAMISGVVGGYFLGRTKKAKLALVLASLFMGRKLGLGPQELIKKGVDKVAEIPQLAELSDRVREDLIAAARTAVTSTANRRIESISDSIHERTENFTEAKKKESEKKSTDNADRSSEAGEQQVVEGSHEAEEEEGEDTNHQGGERALARGPRSTEKRAKRSERSQRERLSRR